MVFPETKVWVALLCALTLAGCGANLQPRPPAPGPQPPGPLVVGDVIETATGKLLTFDELIAQLSQTRIVYVGELHTSAEDHRVQLKILERLYQKNPNLVLAMEMFPRNVQAALDRYSAGASDTDEFLEQTDWEHNWRFPFHLYKALLTFARDHHLKVLGLNAPNDIVGKIAREGLSSLSPEERSQIARDFHLDGAANRRRIESDYHRHMQGPIRDFETFFEAQLAWEETMAETLAGAMAALGPQYQAVVLIGKGHMTDRLGIPDLARQRLPVPYKTVAPMPIDYPGKMSDPDIADYVVITDKPEIGHRPRLGVMVEPAASGAGVEVVNILPDSPAADAGMVKGDVIVSVEGVPVNTVEQLQEAIAVKRPAHSIEIERSGRRMHLRVKIGNP